MQSASLTFAWVLWRQHGAGILLFLGILLVGAAVSVVIPAHNPQDTTRGLFFAACFFTVIASAINLFVIFTYSAAAEVSARESCFPTHLLRLPVSTKSLVLWPIACGAGAALVLWPGFAWFILRPWLELSHDENQLPFWWPAFLGMAIMAWVQALVWSPFGLRGLRILLLGALVPGLVVLAGCVVNSGMSEGMVAALFFSFSVIAWTVSYRGVKHARRGDVPNWEALLGPLYRISHGVPQRHLPFASVQRAQAWHEWRRTGSSLPIMTGLILPVALSPLLLGALPVWPALLGAVAVPWFLAGIAGTTVNAKNPWIKDYHGMAQSTASLPMTTAGLLAAKLKAAALSMLAATALVAVILVFVLVCTGSLDEVARSWRQKLHNGHPVQLAVGIVAFATLVMVWTWKRMVDSLFLQLMERRGTVFAAMIGLAGLWVLAIFFSDHHEIKEATLAIFPSLLALLFLARLVVAGWALRRVLRQNLMEGQTVVRWIMAWLLLGSVLFGTLAWAIPGDFVPLHYLVFGVLFAMPMARLAATPLALAWNRHR